MFILCQHNSRYYKVQVKRGHIHSIVHLRHRPTGPIRTLSKAPSAGSTL